ncbi:DUF4376 domain-containing protein [Pseudoalteromonas rubra]|uniref:DUF4376 domain-containing protein n=1 Tax=Pseudoalteromonas rubra TaxID=43658 RepID=A0A0U3I276_9GAMM|nr:hypothetical protein [Pseudoalteromonas rubra]ALU41951.1 hypothetical protein AT705_02795 [Pseudoalteromonas rubra]
MSSVTFNDVLLAIELGKDIQDIQTLLQKATEVQSDRLCEWNKLRNIAEEYAIEHNIDVNKHLSNFDISNPKPVPTIAVSFDYLSGAMRNRSKENRSHEVARIVVDYNNMRFDGDETSQNRMARACLFMSDTEQVDWILADNTVVKVDKATLMHVGRLAGQKQAALWIK